jgi:hypothetical protein
MLQTVPLPALALGRGLQLRIRSEFSSQYPQTIYMILKAMNVLYKIVSSMLLQALHGLVGIRLLKNNAIKLHLQN